MVHNMNVKTTGIEDPESGLLPILMREASTNGSSPLNLSRAQSPMLLSFRPTSTQLEASTELDSSSSVQAVPLSALSTQSNNVVERTKHAIEQRWGSRQDNHCDQDEDEEDEDNEDEDKEDEDEEEDYEDENERPGLSTWDLLGEAFEREAAALGLS